MSLGQPNMEGEAASFGSEAKQQKESGNVKPCPFPFQDCPHG